MVLRIVKLHQLYHDTDRGSASHYQTRKSPCSDPTTASARSTCVRVPVLSGHSEVPTWKRGAGFSPERARQLPGTHRGAVSVIDDPPAARYPLAIS